MTKLVTDNISRGRLTIINTSEDFCQRNVSDLGTFDRRRHYLKTNKSNTFPNNEYRSLKFFYKRYFKFKTD